MKNLSPHEIVELFHLLFLNQFSHKTDKNLYALKGGCNLRFFFKSIRYSEDIDIDIQTIAKNTLQNKVNRILTSAAFKQILQSHTINIVNITEPKQTETTQRWKIQIKIPNSLLAINTKIEFSRRGMEDDVKFEVIDPDIIRLHHITPLLVNHYSAESALRQKFTALISRNETQARDIFDINLLLNSGVKFIPSNNILEKIEVAKKNTLSLTFEDFKGQVLAFLHPDYQPHYDSTQVWQQMIINVTNILDVTQL